MKRIFLVPIFFLLALISPHQAAAEKPQTSRCKWEGANVTIGLVQLVERDCGYDYAQALYRRDWKEHLKGNYVLALWEAEQLGEMGTVKELKPRLLKGVTVGLTVTVEGAPSEEKLGYFKTLLQDYGATVTTPLAPAKGKKPKKVEMISINLQPQDTGAHFVYKKRSCPAQMIEVKYIEAGYDHTHVFKDHALKDVACEEFLPALLETIEALSYKNNP